MFEDVPREFWFFGLVLAVFAVMWIATIIQSARRVADPSERRC